MNQKTTRPRFLLEWRGRPPSDAVVCALEDGELKIGYYMNKNSLITVSVGETRELARMLSREVAG